MLLSMDEFCAFSREWELTRLTLKTLFGIVVYQCLRAVQKSRGTLVCEVTVVLP